MPRCTTQLRSWSIDCWLSTYDADVGSACVIGREKRHDKLMLGKLKTRCGQGLPYLHECGTGFARHLGRACTALAA
eukprot:4564984-Heterocapsa_arctica.AAC.1